MRAQLTLPEKPSALYLLAVLDIIAVLLIFFALIPAVAEQAGVPLNKMKFSSRMAVSYTHLTLPTNREV